MLFFFFSLCFIIGYRENVVINEDGGEDDDLMCWREALGWPNFVKIERSDVVVMSVRGSRSIGLVLGRGLDWALLFSF